MLNMKQKVDLLIRGNLISSGCISPLCKHKLTGGGGGKPDIIFFETPEALYDLSKATIIEGDVYVDNLYYNGTVVVTGCITAGAEGGGYACR
jgi:hypothetical protein